MHLKQHACNIWELDAEWLISSKMQHDWASKWSTELLYSGGHCKCCASVTKPPLFSMIKVDAWPLYHNWYLQQSHKDLQWLQLCWPFTGFFCGNSLFHIKPYFSGPPRAADDAVQNWFPSLIVPRSFYFLYSYGDPSCNIQWLRIQ